MVRMPGTKSDCRIVLPQPYTSPIPHSLYARSQHKPHANSTQTSHAAYANHIEPHANPTEPYINPLPCSRYTRTQRKPGANPMQTSHTAWTNPVSTPCKPCGTLENLIHAGHNPRKTPYKPGTICKPDTNPISRRTGRTAQWVLNHQSVCATDEPGCYRSLMEDPRRRGCRSAWSRAWVSPAACVKAGGRPHTGLCNHTNPAVVPVLQAGQIHRLGMCPASCLRTRRAAPKARV